MKKTNRTKPIQLVSPIYWLKKSLGWVGQPVLIVLHCYRIKNLMFLSARLAEDAGIGKPNPKAGKLTSLGITIRRYLHSSIEGEEITVEYDGECQYLITDKEGIVETLIIQKEKSDKIRLSYEPTPEVGGKKISIEVPVYDLNRGDFTIISDIDDTVIVSESPHFWRKLRLLLFYNAHTRKPFEGVSDLYQLLSADGGSDQNPMVYVSSSEWNLLDLIRRFLDWNNIPMGVMMLRRYHNSLWDLFTSGGGSHLHKLNKINHLFSLDPNRKYLLIGDSGQKDAEIYTRIYNHYPSQVLGIYIRAGSPEERLQEIRTLFEESGAPYLLTDSSEAMKAHAKKHFLHKTIA